MAFWTYMLICADGRYYTGHTDDLDRRMEEHHAGGHSEFTSRRRPVVLTWCESFQKREEALAAERRVGGWSRAKKGALVRGDWGSVSLFARPPREGFSTSLETNGGMGNDPYQTAGSPASPRTTARLSTDNQGPFVSSDVEKSHPTP